jgi:hypothetical protein
MRKEMMQKGLVVHLEKNIRRTCSKSVDISKCSIGLLVTVAGAGEG